MTEKITDIQQPAQFKDFPLWVVKYKENKHPKQRNFGLLQLAWNFYNANTNQKGF
ncbi:MAG: hypothetical protein IKN73_04320 [Alphaproteobacteria bacterium]|nr:hypothetical protein [Alphaproteobacteria bacterium]